ncbi:type IX secretion system plug protein domain-containing protein [Rubrivirga sp.]|uniref:type IX secretion system plug protein domain-containing protein n=1 Tax=Rubrivirga sp. TaxID=1885344 RepID=UPI003C75C9D8
MPSPRALLIALLVLAGCALPEEGFEVDPPTPTPTRQPGQTVIEDERIGALQLHSRGDEATLPILSLEGSEQLRLRFDILGQDVGEALQISFVHTNLIGQPDLLPSEFMTSFERDDILDFQRSSAASSLPYVHYTYDFPNNTIGFEVSGNYRAIVRTLAGELLFEIPFFVTEQLAEVDLEFGSTVMGGAVGFAVQPAARLRPNARLQEFDGSFYTVCFARNGRTDQFRCAPEPNLIDLSLFQFFLPRDQAFPEQDALFEVDLGFLSINDQVIEVDRAAVPPIAVLDADFAEFGGDVRQAVIAAVPLLSTVYRDVGQVDTDGQYVDTVFRFVPPNGRQLARRVYVTGSFNGWRRVPNAELMWDAAAGLYQGTIRIKQGRYVYGYTGGPGISQGLGAPSLFTAYVYLSDPRTFTDRLIAVRSGVAR